MKQFPKGNDPFQIVSRICEEAGELAQATNHKEGIADKILRHGLPEEGKVSGEAMDLIQNVLALLVYYDLLDEFNERLVLKHDWMVKEIESNIDRLN